MPDWLTMKLIRHNTKREKVRGEKQNALTVKGRLCGMCGNLMECLNPYCRFGQGSELCFVRIALLKISGLRGPGGGACFLSIPTERRVRNLGVLFSAIVRNHNCRTGSQQFTSIPSRLRSYRKKVKLFGSAPSHV